MLRRGLGYALAGVLVLLALGNGIGSQLLPLAERHPDSIAAWLQARGVGPDSRVALLMERFLRRFCALHDRQVTFSEQAHNALTAAQPKEAACS